MPSPRQLRLVMTAAIVTVVIILFFTSGMPREHSPATIQDFYHKTLNAMDGRGGPRGTSVLNSQTGEKAGSIPVDKDADGDVDADDLEMARQMQERLKAAEQQAKDNTKDKGGLRPDPPSHVVGVGSSADGQTKDKAKEAGAAPALADNEHEESAEKHQAQYELNSILQNSPVVIFSKTYCPYSKRAKGLLLEKYVITPVPYVVELDEHPLGRALQEELLKTTGRKTVPNIMINGVSIGGADDIIALDHDGKLVDKIVDLGNKHIDMVARFISGHT